MSTRSPQAHSKGLLLPFSAAADHQPNRCLGLLCVASYPDSPHDIKLPAPPARALSTTTRRPAVHTSAIRNHRSLRFLPATSGPLLHQRYAANAFTTYDTSLPCAAHHLQSCIAGVRKPPPHAHQPAGCATNTTDRAGYKTSSTHTRRSACARAALQVPGAAWGSSTHA